MTILVIGLIGCSHSPVESLIEQDAASIDPVHPPALVELNFESHGERLNGILYQANGAGPHPTVVLLHGYPGNEKNLDLAQSLRRVGAGNKNMGDVLLRKPSFHPEKTVRSMCRATSIRGVFP